MHPIELRSRREALGLSQAALGASVTPPVPQATISAWEAGTRTPRDPASVSLLLSELEDLALEIESSQYEIGEHSSGVLESATVILHTYTDDDSYWDQDASARARHIPAALHRVATARARAALDDELDIMASIQLAGSGSA